MCYRPSFCKLFFLDDCRIHRTGLKLYFCLSNQITFKIHAKSLNAFLTLAGIKKGAIKGSVTQKGREGTIMVIAANHEILASMSNTGGGAAVGKRVHKPFVITKELDKSSPLLYQAMVTGEDLNVWELKFYSAAVTGVEKQNYTVKLTDALLRISGFFFPILKTLNLQNSIHTKK